MSNMSDRDVIAWARRSADIWEQKHGAAAGIVAQYRRLADLAEKGAEDWQDATTTHPKDDRDVLLLVGSKRHIGYFSHIGFIWCIDGLEARPTHWRPLPAPPGGER